MAYMGGFLLLVATLAFEVGGWQDLASGFKLAAVVAVYVVFGVLGFVLRRSAHLRTVGRAYLGVFALMTPLVALAAYRFELQPLGFPVIGMVCVTAAYAAAIYLTLAQRTAFIAYAYLGWMSFTVAALAIVPWSSSPGVWYLVALAATSVVLLASEWLAARLRISHLSMPALHLASLTSVIATVGTLVFAAIELASSAQSSGTPSPAYPIAAFTLASAGVAAAGFLWEHIVRSGVRGIPAGSSDALDAIATGYAVATAVGAAVWAGADRAGVTDVLAVLALLVACRAIVLRRLGAGHRRGLRYALEAMAATLAASGSASVFFDSAPNMPLLAALTAGIAVTLAAAFAEDAPWVVLAAGLFLSLDYHTLVLAIASWTGSDTHFADLTSAALVLSNLTLGLVAALWLAGLGLGFRDATRRYAWPVLLVALGDALFDLLMLLPQPAGYSVPVLVVLALMALLAGWRERHPVWTGFTIGFFGVLASVDVVLNTRAPVPLFLAALVPAALALGIRRWLGRDYAYAPYVVTLCATLLSSSALDLPARSQVPAVPLGMHLSGWLLLAVAALGVAAALMERHAWAMIVPAVLAFGAISIYRAFALFAIYRPEAPVSTAILIVAFAGVGVALRQYRGLGWSVPWHTAAALGALIAALRVATLPNGQTWQVVALLGYAALAYLVALHERQPWATAAMALYSALAVLAIPDSSSLPVTLALTFSLALVGGALRVWLGRSWALGLYVSAAFASCASIVRITPYDAGLAEALLLIFAAVAYVLAALEPRGRTRVLAAIVPAMYAAAAAIAQPDAHALLPLALALGVAGLVVSRIAGLTWAWPFYAVAGIAAVLTAILGLREAGFEAWALLALALLAYVAAALESRAEVLPLALLLGVLALAAALAALGVDAWMDVLAFAALAWIYYAGAELWRSLPGLRPTTAMWWLASSDENAQPLRGVEPRMLGIQIHRWAGLAVAVAVPLSAEAIGDAFAPGAPSAQAGALALFSLAGVLLMHDRQSGMRLLRYVAGGVAALALSWEARWFGAANIQAFVLAPGSYLLVVGSLMPGDERLGQLRGLARHCTLGGALLLLVPTLAQCFLSDTTWLYALLLTVEALALTGYGVGSRSRVLVLTGSLFVGAAALRGAALAVSSGVPVALVIAALALLLMGLATWLSLRVRHEAGML